MSFGAMMLREDGTPFFIDGSLPFSLVRRQAFSVDANANSGSGVSIQLDSTGGQPFIYFVRFDQADGWGYMVQNNGFYYLYAGAFSSGVCSGTIYGFSLAFPSVPAWGIAILNESGQVVLTNETKVLRGVNVITPTGNASQVMYLNEVVAGRKAIVVGRTGAEIYQQVVGGNPITQIITYSTGCYWDGTNTYIRSRPMGRSSASIPLNSSKGNGYAPAYIDTTPYD